MQIYDDFVHLSGFHYLTILLTKGIIPPALKPEFFASQEVRVDVYLDISLIITSIALIASVILQSKGAGLGGLTGSDVGSVFTARRGIEKILFWVTIGLSVIFFILSLVSTIIK